MRIFYYIFFFFYKQKMAYEMRISDWSSDVCSSDLARFVVEDVMRDAQPVAHRARVADVAARAARARAAHRLAVVVELERHPDRLRAARVRERGHHRAVDAARHGDDDAAASRIRAALEIAFDHRRRP